jgi:hypothetical protein
MVAGRRGQGWVARRPSEPVALVLPRRCGWPRCGDAQRWARRLATLPIGRALHRESDCAGMHRPTRRASHDLTRRVLRQKNHPTGGHGSATDRGT